MTRQELYAFAMDLRRAGKNNPQIAQALNERGIKNNVGNDFDASGISYLLTNPPTKEKKGVAPTPSYQKVESNPPPKAAAPIAPQTNDTIMVIIAKPGQLREIAGDLFK